ncbi:MAG: serine/threonine-protein kinase [Polyangiales bacterium]
MTRRLVEQEARARVGALVGGRYELVRLVGCGGCGAVYEARHRNTRGRLAVKLLLADGADEGARRRFEREARILTQLSHPHIVRVFDLGADGDALYLAEELVDGETLRARLREGGPLSPRAAREAVLPLLDALAYAHARGVVHRDVKPENVLLARADDGSTRPVLIDFGVARVDDPDEARTRTGAVIGTPAYMAPEQCLAAAKVDARADVWAVGAVLFECVAARPPFEGSPTETLAALLTLAAPPLRGVCPDAPAALDALLAAALARDPAARPASAAAFAEALRACGELPDAPLARGVGGVEQRTARDTVATLDTPPAPVPVHAKSPRRVGVAVAAALAVAAVVAFARGPSAPVAPASSPRREAARVEAPVAVVVAAPAAAPVAPVVAAPVAPRPRPRVVARAPARPNAPSPPPLSAPSPARGANHALILEP